MNSSLVFVISAGLFVSACSPQQYKVNPPQPEQDYVPGSLPSLKPPRVGELPAEPTTYEPPKESEQEGYIRILGDLRWDQLTSKEEWMKRFPECLTDKYAFKHKISASHPDVTTLKTLHNFFPIIPRPTKQVNGSAPEVVTRQECTNFTPGGIPVNIYEVEFGSNSGTASKTMTTEVTFHFFDNSQSRAFKAALVQKYESKTSNFGHGYDTFYCSKYTCWKLNNIDIAGPITAVPTPYTVSLLDQVQINTSDL